MIINTVITPDTIPDVYEVLDFCREHELMVTVAPQDDWTVMNPRLAADPDYYELIAHVRRMKRRKEPKIILSDLFLQRVSDQANHKCFPTLVPRIYPDGSVFYPCTPLGRTCGNLLDHESLYEMVHDAWRQQGLPDCALGSQQCFLSCFMEPTHMVEHPFRVLAEQLENIA
jgi:MoaA/NifB/PqqE/SkfB family radical SAM enzyme